MVCCFYIQILNKEIQIIITKWIASYNDAFAYDGSAKSRTDTTRILNEQGYESLFIRMFGEQTVDDLVYVEEMVSPGDIVIFQSPIYSSANAEEKYISLLNELGAITIGLLHDIDVIRFGGDLNNYRQLINQYQGLIIASQSLVDVIKPKVPYVIQGPWDYLTDINPLAHTSDEPIVYAGNLTVGKTAFLDEVNYLINTYGERYDRSLEGWQGKYDPNILPSKLEGSYGLVWDSNGYGDYQKYNWSYKFSLYIVSGLPIIARRGSNVGNYVETNHLGFTVDDVLTIDKTNQPYQNYITNVSELANKLKQGKSIIEKVNEIENIISTTI